MHTHPALLRKMTTILADPVQYQLSLGEESIQLNRVLGKKISLRFTGEIFCTQCGRKTSKSFQQGFCFPCYRRLLECGLCVIHPEKCRYYEGICQPDDWAHAHCHVPHVVYLANSSGLKVGITRESQLPTRWIDQGASQAIVIMRCKNRRQAGLLEVALKQYINDKTNWRAMLQRKPADQDLSQTYREILAIAEQALEVLQKEYPDEIECLTATNTVNINYPVQQYPEKITALDLTKTAEVSGILLGIKGQYLILDKGVISIRKFAGYSVQFTLPSSSATAEDLGKSHGQGQNDRVGGSDRSSSEVEICNL